MPALGVVGVMALVAVGQSFAGQLAVGVPSQLVVAIVRVLDEGDFALRAVGVAGDVAVGVGLAGDVARYEWGDAGTVTVHHQDGSRQIYEHDSNARLVSQTDPDGANHQKTYDEQGRLIAEKDPLGAVTEYQYNESGHLTALIPPEDEPTYYSYLDGHVRKIRRGMAQWYWYSVTAPRGSFSAIRRPCSS